VKTIISKIKIIVENSDGTYTESETVTPKEVADKLLSDIIDWKSQWDATYKDAEEFFEDKSSITDKTFIREI
jgi:hypothetical protein